MNARNCVVAEIGWLFSNHDFQALLANLADELAKPTESGEKKGR
jgi:hypothetical protein